LNLPNGWFCCLVSIMATRKKNQPKQPPVEAVEFDSSHFAGTFEPCFLGPQEASLSYKNELLTAEEKAAYYEDLINNNGQENAKKISKDCMKKAGILMEKLDCLDEYEAQPLLEKIAGLVSLANSCSFDPIPPDVLAAQRGADEVGLKNLKPETNADAAARTDAHDNDAEAMMGLKKKAQFWTNIHSWNNAEQSFYYFGHEKNAEWTEAVFIRAQKDPLAVKILAQHGEINYLLELARMGNEDAAHESIELLEKLVRKLNLYAKTDSDAFKNAAAKLMSWPVMYSPHPLLNQNSEKISGDIKIGADLPYEFGKGAKWNPRKRGSIIAMKLYQYIKQVRQYPKSNRSIPFADEASKLPEINIKSPGSVRKWWVVARKILESAYTSEKYERETKREDFEMLKFLETTIQNPERRSSLLAELNLRQKKSELIDDVNLNELTGIKKRYKMRAKILETVQKSFMSLFPKEAR